MFLDIILPLWRRVFPNGEVDRIASKVDSPGLFRGLCIGVTLASAASDVMRLWVYGNYVAKPIMKGVESLF